MLIRPDLVPHFPRSSQAGGILRASGLAFIETGDTVTPCRLDREVYVGGVPDDTHERLANTAWTPNDVTRAELVVMFPVEALGPMLERARAHGLDVIGDRYDTPPGPSADPLRMALFIASSFPGVSNLRALLEERAALGEPSSWGSPEAWKVLVGTDALVTLSSADAGTTKAPDVVLSAVEVPAAPTTGWTAPPKLTPRLPTADELAGVTRDKARTAPIGSAASSASHPAPPTFTDAPEAPPVAPDAPEAPPVAPDAPTAPPVAPDAPEAPLVAPDAPTASPEASDAPTAPPATTRRGRS